MHLLPVFEICTWICILHPMFTPCCCSRGKHGLKGAGNLSMEVLVQWMTCGHREHSGNSTLSLGVMCALELWQEGPLHRDASGGGAAE